jgi:trans-o-hydroxybenzylidenepyruvate hydratase-aldolase
MEGVYAIIPTPAKAGSDHWNAVDTVDVAETARVVNALVADGVDGLIVLGTTGEFATLTRAEYETFVACVLETIASRIPVFIGTTAPGTHEVVERTRFAQERGATGVLVGPPAAAHAGNGG